ncbi:hypothetical protein [Pantoea trifolii]|uniref:hypothetical protein n=1 Tax=Candidatus Pantoea symbiotica TaxID=1884370 RepID=UPI002413735C|nr:hypothetical protein [Pantoea rodasii]
MTNAQLKAHCEDVIANPQDHLDWVVDMARVAMASLESPQELESSALLNAAKYLRNRYICNEGTDSEFIACITPGERSIGTGGEWDNWRLLAAAIDTFPSAPPAPELKLPDEDYFSRLVAAARERAEKAMRKFPQPNYVLNKVAEENGEVIKAVIHYTEGREDWLSVEGELIDNLAMLIRLVKEGDQVIGFNPPDEVKRLNAPHTAPIEPICATGRTMAPHEFSQMVNELRDVENTQSRRAKIVGVLHAFNIRPRKPE